MGKTAWSYSRLVLIVLFISSQALSQEISDKEQYDKGRKLFYAQKNDAAQQALLLVPEQSSYAVKADYIVAAILSRQGKYELAHSLFTKIIDRPLLSVEDRQLKDLAILGSARLYYHQNQMRSAVILYQKLPLDSPYLSRMLYELAMTYISYGDSLYDEPKYAKQLFLSAKKTLNQLLSLDKDMRKDPRVELIRADLLMRLNRTSQGIDAYRALVANCKTLKLSLGKIASNPTRFVNAVFAKDVSRGNAINSWVNSQVEVRQARMLFTRHQKIQNSIRILLRDYVSLREQTSVNSELHQDLDKKIKRAHALQKKLNELLKSYSLVLSKSIILSVESWKRDMNWIIVGAESGMMQGTLRKQRFLEEYIGRVELMKTEELSNLKLELDMAEGVKQ